MTSASSSKTQSRMGLILLAYIAFISLGLPDGLLGVAWPSIRSFFSLPLDALGMMLIAGTSGYITSSFFSGRIMAKLGVGGLLAASCFATGASLLGYTLVPAWWMFVLLGVVAGLGAGAIDAGINNYVAANFSEKLMQWLHASFGVGITLGPIIMTTGLNLTQSWRTGYIVVGVAQITLAVCFFLSMSLWKQGNPTPPAETKEEDRHLLDYKTPLTDTLRQPSVWLSLLLFYVYTGSELILGYWTYSLLTEGRHIAPEIAGFLSGSYWGMFTLGRILAGWYTHRIGQHRLLQISISAALFGAVLVVWNPTNVVSLIGIGLVGFAIAPIFPALVSGTTTRVTPRHTANTIGMQISAAGLGGATLPGIAGFIAQRTSLEAIPIFLMSLFIVLLATYLFSMRGKVQALAE